MRRSLLLSAARPRLFFPTPFGAGGGGGGEEVPAPADPNSMLLGYNMDYPGEGMRISPFLNFFENARPWNQGLGNPLSDLNLDSNGWITSFNNGATRGYSIVMTSDSGSNPEWYGHRFALTWSGPTSGIDIDGASKDYSVPNRIEFNGTDGNVTLNCAAGITNIKIIRKDRESLYAGGQRWNPDFITYAAPFHSLRFMDWASSNSNPENLWSTRTPSNQPWKGAAFKNTSNPSAGYTTSGYNIETMVQLCNDLQKSGHFHIGHLADNTYVTNFSNLICTTVNTTRTHSIEFSNELWNFGFPQANYFNTIGSADYPGVGSAWVQASAKRTREVMTIVKARAAFYGVTAAIKTLMNVQTGWLGLAYDSLTCPNVGGAPCYTPIDRVALTFYFSAGLQYAVNWPLIQSWITTYGLEGSYTRAIQQLRYGNIPGLRNRENDDDITSSNASSFVNICNEVTAQISQAAAIGRDTCYYEWGTHFDDYANTSHRDWLVALCHHTKMEELYELILDFSNTAGIKIANVWGSTEGNTQWAIAASMSDTTHAKRKALGDWRTLHPLS